MLLMSISTQSLGVKDYRAGRLLTGQLKAKCISVLQGFVGDFQKVCKFVYIM